MASNVYESESRRTSRVIHAVPQLYCETSLADFASLYTTKNGTPIMCQKDVTPFTDRSNLERSSQSSLLPCVKWPNDLSFADTTCFTDSPSQTVFCNRFNVQTCLHYLNQEMVSLGLPSMLCGASDEVDSVKFINNVYRLIKLYFPAEASYRQLVDRQQQLERNVEMFSHTNERLRQNLEESEQMASRLELTVSQLRSSNKDLTSKLKVEKDEVQRLNLVSQHREVQYRHESRKKEQELDKMKERMHKLIEDKAKLKAPGLALSKYLDKTMCGESAEVFQSVLGSYVERQAFLLSENGDLRNGLQDLQKQLIAMLHSTTERSTESRETLAEEDAQLQKNDSDSGKDYNSALLTEGCFDLPFDVSGTDVLSSLKQQCDILKHRIHSLENSRSVENSLASRVDELSQMKTKLEEYESVIYQQHELLLQTMQGPFECGDVSYLLETDELEENESLNAKEAYIKQQKEQLDIDRQQLIDFATELAKKRTELENLRLELLHKEFMMLTPFRANRTAARGGAAPIDATPSTSGRFKSMMPTTSDLYRQIGLVAASTQRRHQNGRRSTGNYLLKTRSAIRQALHNPSPSNERAVHPRVIPATILDEEEMLKLDDVKTSLFTGPDSLEKE